MVPSRSFRISAFACAAALAGVACGGSSDGQGGSQPAAESAPGATAQVAEVGESGVRTDGAVPSLLQFTAPLVGGGDISGERLADKPTAFWFWAPT